MLGRAHEPLSYELQRHAYFRQCIIGAARVQAFVERSRPPVPRHAAPCELRGVRGASEHFQMTTRTFAALPLQWFPP